MKKIITAITIVAISLIESQCQQPTSDTTNPEFDELLQKQMVWLAREWLRMT